MTPERERDSLLAKRKFFEARLPAAEAVRYVQYPSGTHPYRILCKLCSATIQEANTNMEGYREVKILFDDASAHVTCLCASCLDKGLDLKTLERLYCSDLVALADEEEVVGNRMHWQMLVDRRPVGFVLET